MNKLKKIVSIIIIMIITVMCCSNISYVYAQDSFNPDDYKPTDTTGGNTEFINMGNIILGILQVVGAIVAVVALMVIGIRYMFGSIQEKASYKETMIPYIIGAVMVFAIPTILRIIFDLVESVNF